MTQTKQPHLSDRVDADADGQRNRRLGLGLPLEPLLQGDRRSHRLPWRLEHGEGLVTAQLEEPARAGADLLAHDVCELPGQPCGCGYADRH